MYQVADFIRHGDFNNYLHINDIGLIRVVQDIKFNKNIQPIALPTTDPNYDNRYLVVTGWGRLQVNIKFIIRFKRLKQLKNFDEYNFNLKNVRFFIIFISKISYLNKT